MTPRVFLSASIPLLERHEKFWKTADNFAIREAVKALTAEIIHQKGQLIFGGHPAITPLVSYMFRHMKMSTKEHVILYQSRLFAKEYPSENANFPNQILTDKIGDGGPSDKSTRDRSLLHMRERMFEEQRFTSAIFIGGMEGIFEEFELLTKIHPKVPKFPIASTGAAAAIAYEDFGIDFPALQNELTYSTLFRKLLSTPQPLSG